MEKVSYQNIEINRWDVGPSTFLASPEKGARLLNWHVNMSDGSVRDVIHWPENNANPLLQEVHGGIPILFPFAGACLHEGKENHWRCPDGVVRQMPMHGFARDSEFVVRSIDKAGFEVELAQRQSDQEFYPFEYTFTVIYHFLELSLQISLILENEGRTPYLGPPACTRIFRCPGERAWVTRSINCRLEQRRSFNTKREA